MANLSRHPLAAIRANCLDCGGGSARYVTWCPCDGVHSRRCHLWPFRFGRRPDTFAAKYGPELVTPGCIPADGVSLDKLPGTLVGAVAWFKMRRSVPVVA